MLQRQAQALSLGHLQVYPRRCQVLRIPVPARRYKHATAQILEREALLPPEEDWMDIFGSKAMRRQITIERVSLRNSDTADRIVESFIPRSGKGAPKVVIEAFPGSFIYGIPAIEFL